MCSRGGCRGRATRCDCAREGESECQCYEPSPPVRAHGTCKDGTTAVLGQESLTSCRCISKGLGRHADHVEGCRANGIEGQDPAQGSEDEIDAEALRRVAPVPHE